MNDSICPVCGRPNPNTMDICQYCGSALKKSATIPLEPLHPGELPTKRKTSDLEGTLPGWLRDVRKANSDENGASSTGSPVEPPAAPAASEPVAKPAQPKPQPQPASPLDFLAGLGQAGEEDEEETPDWLQSLKESMPTPVEPPPAPTPAAAASTNAEPTDWLTNLEAPGAQTSEPELENNLDWGFGNQPATFDFEESSDSAAPTQEATPDWLTALKAQDESSRAFPAAPAPVPATPAHNADENLPDWLSSLSAENGIPAEAAPAATTDAPDWLSALSAESGIPAETAPAATADTPDWLSSLGAESGIPAETAPAAMADAPDWLSSLSAENGIPAEAAPAAITDAPDWLSALSTESGIPAETTPAAMADAPDWLSSLGAESSLPAENTPAATTDAPDWLSSLGAESGLPAENTPAAMADAPDWLSSLGAESGLPAETTPAAMADTSDWLSSLGAESSLPAENTPAATTDAPDWLSSLGAESGLPAETTPAATADAPDWLSSLGAEGGLPAETTPAESLTEADLPDWMSGLSEPVAPVEPLAETKVTAEPEAAAVETGDLPDWLAEAMGENPLEKPVEASKPRKAFDTGSLGDLGSLGQDAALPDWMQGLGTQPEIGYPAESPVESNPEPVAEAKTLFENLPTASLEIPNEIPPVEPTPQPAAQDQNLDAILALDLPDWLSGFTPTKSELETESPDQAVEANLQPADLPSWVQAMRPVESVMAGAGAEDEEDQDLVSSGPLAGLRSVLPGQAGTPASYKSKSYSIKLQVTETQQSQATLLEYLLKSEKTPQTVSRSKETLILRPLRWIIAGMLLLVVLMTALFSDFAGTQLFPLPNLANEALGVSALQTQVENLPEAASVLVVVDYQPGFAGEMETASGAVLRRLMDKNARLALISTTPMGLLLSERLITQADQARAGAAPYRLTEDYVYLGYLPGGAGSIKIFAEQPQRTIGQDWEVGNLWDTPALAGVKKADQVTTLANFSAILVLTDNPDTGRLWIEQTNAALGEIPVPRWLVVSAQAEPLMFPYYLSGQVQGLLAGLEGGARYEALLKTPGPANAHWQTFGAAILTTILLILGGGIWSLFADRRSRRPRPEQDEA